MVRREASGSVTGGPVTPPDASCTDLAGGSPVPVSAGAPGSRPQPSGGDPFGRAGRREPLRREQARGPQHEVKPAASSERQSGSRAAHVTAKATVDAQEPGAESAAKPGG